MAYASSTTYINKIPKAYSHSHGIFQDGGRVAIREANLNSLSKPMCWIIIAKLMKISKFDYNTNVNSVISIAK